MGQQNIYILLIVPYWNWKVDVIEFETWAYIAFNRTILELKVVTAYLTTEGEKLLIVPYWNWKDKVLCF